MAVALAATVSVSNSSIVNGQVVNGVITIYNTGTTPTNLLSVQLTQGSELTNGGQNSMAMPNLNFNGPGVNTTIPAATTTLAGTLNIPFQTTCYCGLQPTLITTTQFAFPLVATILTSDGSLTTSSTATIQDVAPYTQSQAPGQFPYTPTSGPLPAIAVAAPQPGALPNPPVAGQLRFDSNLETLLVTL